MVSLKSQVWSSLVALTPFTSSNTFQNWVSQGLGLSAWTIIERVNKLPFDSHQTARGEYGQSTIAIETFALTPAIAESNADDIEAALDGAHTIGTGAFLRGANVEMTGRADVVYRLAHGDDKEIYAERLTFEIWHPHA